MPVNKVRIRAKKMEKRGEMKVKWLWALELSALGFTAGARADCSEQLQTNVHGVSCTRLDTALTSGEEYIRNG